MRRLLLMLTVLMANFTFGQSPYAIQHAKFRSMFDNIPIDKGQEEEYFNYAIELFKRGILQRAGQIFDRVYWLDTTGILSKQSLMYRNIIEQRVICQTKENLFNTWYWEWSGTNWGATESRNSSHQTKRLVISEHKIQFYVNDSLVRTTAYNLNQHFDWVNGFIINCIIYNDSKEEWYYNLLGWNSFTSDNLRIEKKTNYACGTFGETYGLSK